MAEFIVLHFVHNINSRTLHLIRNLMEISYFSVKLSIFSKHTRTDRRIILIRILIGTFVLVDVLNLFPEYSKRVMKRPV